MPFQFDAVVWEAIEPFVLVLAPVLLLDGIIIFILKRRSWTTRLNATRPDDEKETNHNVLSGTSIHADPIIIEQTRTYRDSSEFVTTNT